MAGVYQKRGTWYVVVKDAAGKWRRTATKAATKTEARRIAAELERKAERQRFGLEPMPGDSSLTLAQLCLWWLEKRCSDASRYDEQKRLGRHVIGTPLGAVPLRFVTPSLVDERLREMQRDGASPASANKLRSVLHTVYSRARKAAVWTGPNPIAEVETRKVPKRAYATLRAEEVPGLLANVPADWRGIFATALYTAMRKGEILGLQKSDVDVYALTITVARSYDRGTTKGGHADAIPIAEPLGPFLADAIATAPGELVFPMPDGSMRKDESDPQKVLRRALGRAGLVLGYDHVCRRCKGRHAEPNTWRHADAGERRCPTCNMRLWPRAVPRPMRFHDLRHTTATLLLRAGVDAHRVQRILRHRDVKTTTAIYGHLDVEDLRGAMDALPGLRASTPPAPPAGSAGYAQHERGDRDQFERGDRDQSANTPPLVTRLLPESGSQKHEEPTVQKTPGTIGPSSWALQVSNLRPPPCEGGALPLS